jgi:predicted DsbA family dithiol-disulfide isomerase
MLTIYGDFNCPFSALASMRADVLLAGGLYEIEWRAVQHDTAIPTAGEPVDEPTAAALQDEVAMILELNRNELDLTLVVPPVRSNTGLASAAFAAAGGHADDLRRRLFAAVWSEGRNISNPAELRRLHAVARDVDTARRWQTDFDALPRPTTPTLVLEDGYVSRGLGALTRLAGLATVSSS